MTTPNEIPTPRILPVIKALRYIYVDVPEEHKKDVLKTEELLTTLERELAEAKADQSPVSREDVHELQDILRTLTNSETALSTSARELVATYAAVKAEHDRLKVELDTAKWALMQLPDAHEFDSVVTENKRLKTKLEKVNRRVQAAESINLGYRSMEQKLDETLHQLNQAEKELKDATSRSDQWRAVAEGLYPYAVSQQAHVTMSGEGRLHSVIAAFNQLKDKSK